jgi:hypothetical protein
MGFLADALALDRGEPVTMAAGTPVAEAAGPVSGTGGRSFVNL